MNGSEAHYTNVVIPVAIFAGDRQDRPWRDLRMSFAGSGIELGTETSYV